MLLSLDLKIISFLRKIFFPMSRIALFVVYFWFGILKVTGDSPANPLVEALQHQTLPFLTFSQFIIAFGIFEMIIGIAFLIPGFERSAIFLLFLHMITTVMPLIFLPQMAWQGTFVPTLEGQYIIKNLALIALAIGIGANLKPMRSR